MVQEVKNKASNRRLVLRVIARRNATKQSPQIKKDFCIFHFSPWINPWADLVEGFPNPVIARRESQIPDAAIPRIPQLLDDPRQFIKRVG